jgi:hypothetical protein
VLRSGTRITKYVDGFVWTRQLNGKCLWSVEGRLADKVESWKEQRRREREEEDMRRIRHRWDDSMDVDDGPAEDASEESDVAYIQALSRTPNYHNARTPPPPSLRTIVRNLTTTPTHHFSPHSHQPRGPTSHPTTQTQP